MDGFVPALVAALLASATDKPGWLAAILSSRFGRPGAVIAGLAAAQLAVMAIAAAGAAAVTPMLNPNARALLFALSLIMAGAGAMMPPKPPKDRLDGWRLGALPTSFAGLFILAFGERVQFIAFGAAAAGSSPWLAAAGAVVGACVPGIVAASLGEGEWRRLPLRAVGIGAGMLLLGAGLVMALGALRLI